MLDKIQRQNCIVERNAMNLMEETGGAPDLKEEDMGVSIGNETHYHYAPPPPQQQQPPAPQPMPTPLPAPQPQPQLPPQPVQQNKSMWPYGAAALAAITAAGLGGYMLNNNKVPPKVPVEPPSVDTDTLTDVIPGFGTPQYYSE